MAKVTHLRWHNTGNSATGKDITHQDGISAILDKCGVEDRGVDDMSFYGFDLLALDEGDSMVIEGKTVTLRRRKIHDRTSQGYREELIFLVR